MTRLAISENAMKHGRGMVSFLLERVYTDCTNIKFVTLVMNNS